MSNQLLHATILLFGGICCGVCDSLSFKYGPSHECNYTNQIACDLFTSDHVIIPPEYKCCTGQDQRCVDGLCIDIKPRHKLCHVNSTALDCMLWFSSCCRKTELCIPKHLGDKLG
jgi:hypothetical protein